MSAAYDALKEALLKRADVPNSVLTSVDLVVDDPPSAELSSCPSTAVPVVRTVPQLTAAGSLDDLGQTDADLCRPGLRSSADDLHKTDQTPAAAATLNVRFLRSKSHQSLFPLDIPSAASAVNHHLVAPTLKRTRMSPEVVRRRRQEPTDQLSVPVDSAICSSGAMIMQICGIRVTPPTTTHKTRSSNV